MKGLQITSEPSNAAIFDAIDALEALGYSDSAIRSVIDTAPKNSSADAIIKCRLCRL